MNLAVKLKDTMLQLERDPLDPRGYSIHVPYSLLSSTREFLATYAMTKEHGDQIVRHELHSSSLETMIRQVLARLESLGKNWKKDRDLVERSVQYVVKHAIDNYPCHVAWKPVRSGIYNTDEEVDLINRQVGLTSFCYTSSFYELEYGVSNALFCWSGDRWRLTPLGEFFMTLSFPAGTVYLLLIEMYYSVPHASGPFEITPWHISREFLEAICGLESATVDIGQEEYTLLNLDPNLDFINRLTSFELVQIVDRTEERRIPQEEMDVPILYLGDDLYESSLTEYGKHIVRQSLQQQDEPLSVLVSSLIDFEITGSNYYNFKDSTSLEELVAIAKDFAPITGDQQDAIDEIAKHWQSGSPPILILRALPPTIETVLRNILVHHGKLAETEAGRIMWRGLCNKFEELGNNKVVILKRDTLAYLKNLMRNDFLHGSISPNDQCASAFANLMCNVLLKIYQNYASWKCSQNK